ncbi:MAG: MraY family glycosyltransferase [Anaerolineae bacterium]|nr:undecaprenyl/decaprenyl-phosphate alpha-N-acetylglucosaminyl 1-phosphate transferase [Thermoflexales bacterium]MDW8406590.1 MraY family glycosyltransferase [Anaerolineae bacterium]
MLNTVIILFVGALVIALAMTPVSKWLAPHVGVMDRPNARKIHAAPVPRMGGLAIFIAVMAVVGLFGGQQEIQQTAAILFGAAFMSFLGLADDRFTLSAYLRLALQLGAALFVWFAGVRVQMLSIEWLDAALTVLWIVGISNAMNFLDNMDGLLAGISAVMSGFFLVLAVLNGQVLVATLSAALMGACIGFLFWNLNPASVFMGDSGSMFLGFLLACVAIKLRFVAQTPSVSWMVPVIVMALPIFDMTMVVISRLRRGKNPLTTPGKDHTSHRIAAHGFSRREAVLILYLVCCVLGLVALLVSIADETAARILGLAVAGVAAYMLWYMEFGPWKLKINPDDQISVSQ